jgi:hypothetical protein
VTSSFATVRTQRCWRIDGLLFVLLLGLVSGACESDGARAHQAFAAEAGPRDSLERVLAEERALAEEQARLDSIARWQERFGNRVLRPDSIRALYVNGWAAGSRSRMAELLRVARETEINSFVIDIKESDTYLTYDSTGIALAIEIGAHERPASRWLPELVRTLQDEAIYPIARIVVFKDRMLAEKRTDLAIRHVDGGTWLDQRGKPWVNPYDRTVWEYNIDIAREALEMGFSEIQWDYVRFPDVVASLQRTMSFPGSDGVSRDDNIRNFIAYSKEKLAEYQVPITADVFGLSTHVEGGVGIGQQWEKLIEVADALLPMVYPSHYYTGMYGFSHPNAHPYEIVRISMQEAVERTEALRRQGVEVGEVIPWLQAFSATWLDNIQYGPEHLRNQIQATYDAGLTSWVLWNPSTRYQVYYPALRGADGSPSALERSGWRPVAWEVPRSRMSVAIRNRERAERAAESAAAAAGDSVLGAIPTVDAEDSREP